MSDRRALEALLRQRSLLFGDFVLASGEPSRYYIDARKTTMSAEGLQLIGALGLEAIRQAGWAPNAVGGLTLGADPIAYAIAAASAATPPVVNAFSVRRAVKDHGTQRPIEGNLEPGSQAVVVEDVITSGRSALLALEAVRREGATVLGVLALVDREQGGAGRIEAQGIKVVLLTTASRIIGSSS